MALAVAERNALLEEVWSLHAARDYKAVAELIGDLPLEEHLKDPELGVMLCAAWYQVGELNRSILLIQQITGACELRGNTRLCRRRMNNEALIRIARGELAEAEPLLHRAASLAEDAGDILITAWVHNNLATLYAMRGMWDFSLSHGRRSVAAGQRLGDTRHVSLCYLNMGITYLRAENLRESAVYLNLAAELSREVGSESELAHIELAQACLHEQEGDIELALTTGHMANRKFATLSNRKGEAGIMQLRGRIALRLGRPAEARALFEEALSVFRSASFRDGEAQVLSELAELCRSEGRQSEFEDLIRKSIALHTRMGNSCEAERLQTRLAAVG